MSRLGKLGHGLYTGQVSYDFVGKWRRWLALSGLVIVVGLIGLGVRGINESVEFKGGSVFTFDNNDYTTSQVTTVVDNAGVTEPVVQKLTPISGKASYRVETEPLDQPQIDKVKAALQSQLDATNINTQNVGSSWGQQITNKAIESLVIFIVAIVIYLSLRYEWKMAAAAIIALIHDLIVTVGIYALVGFEVSPSTVIGLLTILGYSLYDTVVVFDKVRENTKDIAGGSRMSYSDAANLGVNQTLVRSINTSVIALLPVASLLFVGAGLLGAGSLKDLALALFIGLATGTYSSIFIATPLLGLFKEREPQYQALAKRVASRRAASARTPVAVGASAGGSGRSGGPGSVGTAVAERPSLRKPRDGGATSSGGNRTRADDGPVGEVDDAAATDAATDADSPVEEPAGVPSPAPGLGRPASPATRRPNAAQHRPGGRPSGKKRHR